MLSIVLLCNLIPSSEFVGTITSTASPLSWSSDPSRITDVCDTEFRCNFLIGMLPLEVEDLDQLNTSLLELMGCTFSAAKAYCWLLLEPASRSWCFCRASAAEQIGRSSWRAIFDFELQTLTAGAP